MAKSSKSIKLGSLSETEGSLRVIEKKSDRDKVPLRKSAQLKIHLLDMLKTGELKSGVAMPSEPRLAEQFKVSRPTVRQALADMEQEGLIRREQGRGTFVNENAQQQLRSVSGTFVLLLCGAHDATSLPLIKGFERYCRSSRHNMCLCGSENDINLQAEMVLRLSRRDIAGVAILPVTAPPTPDYHIAALQEKQIPVVFCHRGVDGTKGPSLLVPHEEEGRLVGRAFAENGHRRVAIVTGYRIDGVFEKWVRGIREALRAVGGEVPDEFIFSPESTSMDPKQLDAELSETLEETLGSKNPPTAIFVAHDVFAQAVYFKLERMGYRIPEDISLIGIGDIKREGAFFERLTSVVIDGEEMGRRAVELLDQIRNNQRDMLDSESIFVDVSISIGETLAAPPGSPLRYRSEKRAVSRA